MTVIKQKRLLALGWSAVVVGLALAVILTWLALDRPGSGEGHAILEAPDDSFVITGDLAQAIVPGSMTPLDLTFNNPHQAAMSVVSIEVSIGSVSAPNATASLPCTVDDFTVEQARTNLEFVVAANSTASLDELSIPVENWPAVGMLNTASNQDGCKGASLTLEYTAVGRFEG